MSRRSFCLALGVLLVLTVGGAAALAALVRHEPEQYAHRPAAEEPAVLQQQSREFTKRFADLKNAFSGEREWEEEFTDEQINSYLEGGFVDSNIDRLILPEGISRPRVAFGTDRIQLAFRYGSGAWSTVISIDLKVWLPKCEPNVVALELEGFHAGALPISAQSLLERVAEVGRSNGIDVQWYRTNGHPVALLRFGTDQPRTTVLLDVVKFQPGSLLVKGHAIEPSAARVAADAGPQPAEN
jgi:hypothetical protein